MGARQSIKVVEEPSNYGMNFGGGYGDAAPAENVLQMRVRPANFSGPEHLRVLRGRCYKLVTEEYKYVFCPFSNVTQHEQSLRWNPYSGILGVWEEWEVENNTLVAMVMREGDRCGDTPRSVRILLKCGNKTRLASVSEPSKCQYEMDFYSTLFCHANALLVYPTLPGELQHAWDVLQSQYQLGELTYQGYRKLVRAEVLERAGLCLAAQARERLAAQAQHEDEVHAKHDQGEYETLDQCTQELKRLKDRVKRYQEMLELNGINPDNGKAERAGPEDGGDMMDGLYDSAQDYYGAYDHDLHG